MRHPIRKTGLRTVVTSSLVLAMAAAVVSGNAATASHFRASGPDFTVTGHQATWQITSAWRSDDSGTFVDDGETVAVRSISSFSDEPGSGTPTEVSLAVVSVVESMEPLYAQVVETLQGDLSSLPDGSYELYVEQCCRVSGIENSSSEDFSQWVRFSKSGSVYSVAPRLTTPVIYAPLALDGTTTMVSYAAQGALSWTAVTVADAPYYGSSALPCSVFSGGALEIGAEHCTSEDVYADIYTSGSYWAFKTVIADPSGRQSVAETLFRVESLPEPYIDRHAWSEGGRTAQFWTYAPDTLVLSWVMTCTNNANPGDVRSATSPTMPVSVTGFTAGASYDCVVSATNGAGTGTSHEGDYVITSPDLTLDLNFVVGDVYAGKTATLEGSGLDPESDYSLTMYSDPVLLDEGVTDGDGSFSNEVVIPQEACIPGEHELRLLGQSDGADVTASQYVEIDESCTVITINGVGAQLAATGPRDVSPLVALLVLGFVLGGALVVRAETRRRASGVSA